MSLLDDLIFGLRDVYDAKGEQLPTRSKLQFGRGLSAIDNPATGRIEVHAEGGGGGGIGTVATLAALRAIPSAGLTSSDLRLVEETGILWRYEPVTGADEIDDGTLSVKPSDKGQDKPGRWRPLTLPGLPAWEITPGWLLPAAHIPASVLVLSSRPITDDAPEPPPLVAALAVDMGDERGVKRPWQVLFAEEGVWHFGSLDPNNPNPAKYASAQSAGFSFEGGGGGKRFWVKAGLPGHTAADLSLTVAAGDRGYGDGAGTATLKGGDDLASRATSPI